MVTILESLFELLASDVAVMNKVLYNYLNLLVVGGKINSSQIRKAQEWINDNRDLLKWNWNEFSNGIKIAV